MSVRRKGNPENRNNNNTSSGGLLPCSEPAAEVVVCADGRNSSPGLCLWNPQPIARPQVDPRILELPAPQRGIEVVVYWVGRTEHWLSPTGWLRAWIRLNVWVAVVLAACAFTVVPAITAVVAGLTGLTLELSRISDDLGRSFASLLPLLSALILLGVGMYYARRHREQIPWPGAWRGIAMGKEESK